MYIGNDVSISRGTYFHGSNHKFDNPNLPIMKQGTEAASLDYKDKTYSIVICDDVWIGSNVIILPNINIGKGSIIGAGSVVTKNIPEYSVAVGVPARVIKNRK